MIVDPPFRPHPPKSTDEDLAIALLGHEFPASGVTGILSSPKPEAILNSIGTLSLVVAALDDDHLMQVLARHEGERTGWIALSLDPVPSWLVLDGDSGVGTRVTGLEDGVVEVRLSINGGVLEVPSLAGRLCLVEWGVANEKDLPWPKPIALRRSDGWHDPVSPGIYMTEPGLIDAYPLTADPNRNQLVASLYLDAIVSEQPKRALNLIRRIMERANDDELGLIGAGPMEELVIEHGAQLLGDIKRLAETDERFRRVLQAAWIGRAPKHVRRELAEFGCG